MSNDKLSGTKPYNTYVAGLITEAGPLTYPENASTDELNCLLFREGNRRRRLGVDYEDSYALSSATLTTATVRDKAIKTFVWEAVAGTGTRNFLVMQVNTTLYYYDLATEPLSNGLKGFTTNVATYAASGATDVGSETVNMDSGKGVLFVSSPKIEPFLVEYNSTTNAITETQINIKIRDFDGLDDGLDPEEEIASSATNIKHEYNLKNQGWNSPGEGIADPTDTYKSSKSKWPPNSKQWWVGKDSSDNFSAEVLAKYDAGNTLAPRGHFLLNPFYKDRSSVSGVTGLTVESEATRPAQVAFFAGRTWYFGIDSSNINGHVFFSQVITETNKAGRCYQESDPTTEDLNQLLDSDGGVIVIPEIGSIRGHFITDRYLVLFATNGVWSISGGGEDGFKATDFQVQKISSVGCVNGEAIVDVEGVPYWWSHTGIYTLGADQVSGKLAAQSMTQNTMESFYQDQIPAVSKTFARGIFDPASKRVYWFYNTVAPVDDEYKYRFNAALIFETSMGSFYPWKISDLTSNSPYIIGLFNTQSVNAVGRTERVADGDGDLLINLAGNELVVDVQTISGSNTFLKWLIMKPTGSDANKWTFGLFNNGDFIDWEQDDGTGLTYSSYLETGFELLGDMAAKKQTPIIHFFFGKTETATAGGALVNPGSCFLTAKWDWTDSGNTGKWSTKRQIYRLKRYFDSGIITDEAPGQTVIVGREKIRGRGRAVQLRFESEAGKDFNLHGWQIYASA